ncbi:hypothetical protein D9611_010037 [Ephemerocybe angulata]|uniref:DUF6533 domain-containing protein n=1 Tax=Ephemerocybe angulata TaxID=980116 RepID=A0A8H5C4K2_9AGAR|nr:hypothetical protein D9611_010037 [Tulosesus angulatus]
MDEGLDPGGGISLSPAQVVAAASMGMLYYDYFLTFTREVEWIWFGPYKLSWATLFFFANRYLTVLGHIPYMYEFFSFRNDPSRLSVPLMLDVHTSSTSPPTVFLIARTHALWDRNRIVLAALTGVSTVVIIYTCVIYVSTHNEFYSDSPTLLRPYSCLFEFSEKRHYQMLTAWIGVLVFDFIVFILSVYRVVEYARRERPPILQLLARDGTVYFGLVSLSCFFTVLTYWPKVLVSDSYSRGAAEVFANSLSSTLASRLFLNLRDPSVLSNSARYDPAQPWFAEDARFGFFPNRHLQTRAENYRYSEGGQAVTMSVQLQTLDYHMGESSGDLEGGAKITRTVDSSMQ